MKFKLFKYILPIAVLFFFSTSRARDEYSIVKTDSNMVVYYYNSGMEYSNNEYYEKATADLLKGVSLIEAKGESIDLDSKFELMKYYKLLGLNYRKLYNFRKSKYYFDLAKEIGTTNFPDSLMTLRLDVGIGRLYFQNSEFERAKKHYDLAYRNLTAHPEYSHLNDYHRLFVNIYNDLGRLYYRQSLYELANENYHKSLEKALKAPKLDTLYTALMYNNLGNVAHQIGDLDKALEYYDRSLQIKNIHQKDYNSIFRTICNRGKVFTDKGELQKALKILIDAHEILQNYDRCNPVMIAWNYNNIGNAYKNDGRFYKAIENYNNAVKIYREIYGNKNYMIVKGLLNISDCHFELKEFKKAKKRINESLKISRDIFGDVHTDVAGAYYRIGKIYEAEKKYKKALKKYNQAILSIRYKYFDFSNENIIDAPFYLKLLEVKADLLNKIYNKKSGIHNLFRAFRHYELAFEILTKMQAGFKNDGSKFTLAKSASKMYGKAVKIAVNLYRETNNKEFKNYAYQFAEMNKANTLLQKLYLSQARNFSEIPAHIVRYEDSLKVQLTMLDTELKLIKTNKQKQNQLRIKSLEENYFRLKEDIEKLYKNLERNYPKYYSLKYKNRTIDTDQIRLKLNHESAIIQYLIADDKLFFFVLTDQDFDIIDVPLTKNYSEEISKLLDGITLRNFKKYTSSAFKLYNQFFRPVEDYIKNRKEIILIPDGEIGSIPFEALLVRGANSSESQSYHKLYYLVKDYNFTYHLSTNLLFSDFNKCTTSPKYDYMGIAPKFNDDNFGVVKVLQGNLNPLAEKIYRRQPLKYTFEEVSEIRNKFKASYDFGKWFNSIWDDNYLRIYFGNSASEENFKNSKYSDYKYLHFATHCIIDKNVPELSGLILSKSTGKEDGILYLNEIYNLKINAELVTLSACETAKGKWIHGEGVIGFSRGFIYAGAKNILVSFWKVNDYSTSRFMKTFYGNMIENKLGKSSALRKTKLEMINSGFDYAMPYYWASFKLIGNCN